MLFVDVNVLVYAHRRESPRHEDFLDWLEAARTGDEPLGISDIVLAGFVRVVTHPKVFRDPTPISDALGFAQATRSSPAALPVHAGSRTWPIFVELAGEAEVRGNLVPDALLAAMTIEQGATLVTADRGFARWKKLDWRHPLDD